MGVPDTGKEALGTLAKLRPDSVLLVAAIVFLVWTHSQEVKELSNQLKASNFIQGMANCADRECQDRFIATFTDWIDLRKAVCE